MGALTNRKRGGEFLNLLPKHPHISSPDVQPSKRLKSSSKYQGQESLRSTASRVLRYPEISTRPGRKLHAPVRPPKFGLCTDREYRATTRIRDFEREQYAACEIGNVHAGTNQMPERNAFCTSSYFIEGKQVIDLADDETQERQNNVISEDSSIEEMDPPSDRNRLKAVDMGAANLQGSVVLDLSNEDAVGVENAGNMLVSLSVERAEESKALSLAAYKDLLQKALRRDGKIREIDFNTKLYEERLSVFKLMHPEKKQQEIPREPFLPLTDEEETEVNRALSGNRRKVLVVHKNSNIEISGEALQCLRPFAWLNDEVINLYLELLKERENREPKKFLKCHFFNTFFYKKLIGGVKGGYDYKSVRRWTTQRKLGYSLVDCDKIFVPIHQEIHWCLAIINKKEKKFQYLDSLRGKDSHVMKVLARYFADEVKDKNGKDIDVQSWQQEYVEDLPEQENGYDCGMFMIKYADFYSRGLALCFNQEHMPYFRLRTTKEILKLRAD